MRRRAYLSSIPREHSFARFAKVCKALRWLMLLRVDSQDNIWAVDEGTDMVIKFNPEGRVVMLTLAAGRNMAKA